jgi:hypothetical protein
LIKDPKSSREAALANLAELYRDAMQLATESKRAIDSFTGEIPPNSPYRYLRMSVGDAIIAYLEREGKPKTVADLVRELEAGHCVFGLIKSAVEIVRKSVNAYTQAGRLMWMDRGKTLVGLPVWKKRR